MISESVFYIKVIGMKYDKLIETSFTALRFVPFLSTYCESLNMTCPTMQKINATKIECKINCNMNESCNGKFSFSIGICIIILIPLYLVPFV